MVLVSRFDGPLKKKPVPRVSVFGLLQRDCNDLNYMAVNENNVLIYKIAPSLEDLHAGQF